MHLAHSFWSDKTFGSLTENLSEISLFEKNWHNCELCQTELTSDNTPATKIFGFYSFLWQDKFYSISEQIYRSQGMCVWETSEILLLERNWHKCVICQQKWHQTIHQQQIYLDITLFSDKTNSFQFVKRFTDLKACLVWQIFIRNSVTSENMAQILMYRPDTADFRQLRQFRYFREDGKNVNLYYVRQNWSQTIYRH